MSVLGGTADFEAVDLPVLTAVTDAALEADLVGAFGSGQFGVTVVRRCVDLVELLAAASIRSARAALVSADLRGLDRAAISQLSAYGMATVGIAQDEPGERLLHQLGAAAVVPGAAKPAQVAGALQAAVQSVPTATGETPRRSLPNDTRRRAARAVSAPGRPVVDQLAPAAGCVLAVWGTTGAPGRSTISVGVADALAHRALTPAPETAAGVLLIDADPYGGCLAQLTGVLDESPGLAAACRAGNAGTLDAARLAACCRRLTPELRLLTGLDDAARWPELRPAALELVLRLARRSAAVTVVDCGFCLDEPGAGPDGAARRNAATLACLREADRIIAVTSAEPVALARFVRELPHLAEALDTSVEELVDSERLVVVVNRVRPGLAAGDPARGIAQALDHHAGVRLLTTLPLDQPAADASVAQGRLLTEAAPDSDLAAALNLLARDLTRAFAPERRQPAPGRRRRPGRRRLRSGTG